MLAIHLSGRSGLSRYHAAEQNALYAVSSSLRTAQQSDDVAIYHGGLWHSVSSAEAYDRVSIDQPCTVRLANLDADPDEDKAVFLGPFAGVIIANGVIKTPGHKPQLLAIFDDSLEQWRAMDDTVWAVVAIEEATISDITAA